MANLPPNFVPSISEEVPWHTRQHIQLLYQSVGNIMQAFAHISKVTGITQTTVIEQNAATTSAGGSSGLGSVNNQTGNVAYTTTVADNGTLLLLNDASPVAVTLNSGVSAPWLIFTTNLGAGLVTFTPTSGTINGAATFTLPLDYTSLIVFNGTNWFATALPIVPQNTPAVAHEWINAYNSATGAFTQTQPAFPDISGNLATSQLPLAGLTTTIVTAKLTSGGTNGSMTFTSGLLTASTPAT